MGDYVGDPYPYAKFHHDTFTPLRPQICENAHQVTRLVFLVLLGLRVRVTVVQKWTTPCLFHNLPNFHTELKLVWWKRHKSVKQLRKVVVIPTASRPEVEPATCRWHVWRPLPLTHHTIDHVYDQTDHDRKLEGKKSGNWFTAWTVCWVWKGSLLSTDIDDHRNDNRTVGGHCRSVSCGLNYDVHTLETKWDIKERE